jgi:hypothetical protein
VKVRPRAADVGFVAPRDAGHAGQIVAEIKAAQDAAGRSGETLHVLGDLVVFIGPGAAGKDRLDELAGFSFRERRRDLHRDRRPSSPSPTSA